MEIPKKYQKIVEDLVEVKDFLYLDSLVFALRSNIDKVLFSETQNLTEDGHAFYKYVYELIDSFYEKHFVSKKKIHSQAFALWLLKNHSVIRLSIPHHSELDY